MDYKARFKEIEEAADIAVAELIKVAREKIVTGKKDKDPEPEKMKIAAQAKKISIFEAMDIMNKVEEERKKLLAAEEGEGDEKEVVKKERKGGFAERHASK